MPVFISFLSFPKQTNRLKVAVKTRITCVNLFYEGKKTLQDCVDKEVQKICRMIMKIHCI